MNRSELRQLTEDRVLDANALLDASSADRWSGAYYLAGYALECGLKACVLALVERTGEIFRDKRFSEKCFTHRLPELINVAGLRDDHEDRLRTNLAFLGYWGTANAWTEASRYQQKTEVVARALSEAITHDPNGLLGWIRMN